MRTVQIRSRATGPVTPRKISVHAPEVAALPVKSAQRPPCADLPDSWDLDAGTPEAWQSAVRTCNSCPLIAQCRQLVQTLIARGDGPRAMIWAGIAYDNSGNVIENLDRHRTVPVDHKRPLRIIRNGSRPLPNQSVTSVPQRHIVLGRPLRPTGTGGL